MGILLGYRRLDGAASVQQLRRFDRDGVDAVVARPRIASLLIETACQCVGSFASVRSTLDGVVPARIWDGAVAAGGAEELADRPAVARDAPA